MRKEGPGRGGVRMGVGLRMSDRCCRAGSGVARPARGRGLSLRGRDGGGAAGRQRYGGRPAPARPQPVSAVLETPRKTALDGVGTACRQPSRREGSFHSCLFRPYPTRMRVLPLALECSCVLVHYLLLSGALIRVQGAYIRYMKRNKTINLMQQ